MIGNFKDGYVSQSPFSVAFFLFLFAAVRLSAQAVNATMSGTIHDKTGAVIPGARVTVTNVDTNITQTVSASAGGEYNVLNLAPAHYRLDVEAPASRTMCRPASRSMSDRRQTRRSPSS